MDLLLVLSGVSLVAAVCWWIGLNISDGFIHMSGALRGDGQKDWGPSLSTWLTWLVWW